MQVVLLYANKTPDDVLLRDKFDDLAKADPRFTVKYLLSRPPANGNSTSAWATSGRINSAFISKHCPAPSKEHLIFVRSLPCS